MAAFFFFLDDMIQSKLHCLRQLKLQQNTKDIVYEFKFF